MRTHHRNYAFRPPYRDKERLKGPLALFFRFIREYVAPFKKMIFICVLVSLLNYCGSFYLLAYYSKVVIDSILVVTPPPVESVVENKTEQSVVGRELEKEKLQAPKTEIKEHFSVRPPGARQKLWGIFLLYVFTLVCTNLLARKGTRLRIKIGQRLTLKLREDMHDKVMRLSLAYYAIHTPGRLLARIISDTGQVQQQVMKILVGGVSQVVIVIIGSLILLIINWHMMLIVALSLPLYTMIYKISNPVLVKIQREMSHTNTCLWGLVSQKVDAIRMIQACNREKKEKLNFRRLASCYLRDSMTQNRVAAVASNLGVSLSGLTSGVAVFLYGIHQVLNNNLTLGEMMYAWGIACALFGPILELTNLNATFANLLVYLRRLAEILDEPVRISDAPDAVELPVPLRRGIFLNNLCFRYDPDGEDILKDISLSVASGSWLCIVGVSGSGKTTLLHLIDRLFEPDSGTILFDDIPLQKIRLTSLRKKIALVPQEAQIISGTISENICYGWPDAAPAQIIAAAKAAELHDFVMTLPAKYETVLGEKGVTLSGGQKQRLSLARALITNPDVLLLDDCTSSLDAETEKKIQETLSRIMTGKTAVIVSQRISMARLCRKICVIENGLVADSGTHDELIGHDGFYARLYARQTE